MSLDLYFSQPIPESLSQLLTDGLHCSPCLSSTSPANFITIAVMADADIATRAPENDAAEDTSASSPSLPTFAAPAVGAADADSAAPADPKLCDDCVTDRPTRA